MKLGYWIAVLPVLFVMSACKRELVYDTSDRGWFPAAEGKYRIYKVDSIRWVRCEANCAYDTLIGTKNNKFFRAKKAVFRKDLTDSVETDLRERQTHRLHIHYAPYDSVNDTYGPFDFFQVWTQYKDQYQAERIEANIKYVVLRFPPSTKITWNGNEFNARGRENYRYISIDTTVVVNGRTFNNCAFVLQRRRSSLSEDVYSYEIYAPGVGMIERYNHEFVFFNGSDNLGVPYTELLRGTVEHLTLWEHNYHQAN